MAKETFRFSGDDALNYEQYLGPVLFEPSALEFLSYLGSPNIRSVLEVSSGTGRLTRHLRNYFPATTKLIASDLSPDMLAVARERLNDPSIEFRVADAQQLPFDADSFDLVVCHYGLMFLPDKQQGFREIFRVLKPGGRFVFATWDRTENMPLLDLIFNGLVIPFFKEADSSRFRIPFSLHEPARLLALLEEAGFTDNRVSPITFKSGASSPKAIVSGFFLKHRLAREVAEREPGAEMRIADEMEKRIATEFGRDQIITDLKAFIGEGRK